MITEQAIVRRAAGARVELELQRDSSCGGCELRDGCGVGALGRLLGRRRNSLVIETDRRLRPGDSVMLELPERALVRLSLLVYGLPVAGLLGGALLPAALWPDAPDAVAVVCGAAGFCVGAKLAARRSARLPRGALLPKIVDIEVNPANRSGS